MSDTIHNSAVVLLSGGVDSVTLLHYVRKKLNLDDVYALSVLYGQKHSQELEMAKWQAEKVGVTEHRIIDIAPFAGLIEGSTALTDKDIDVPDLSDVPESDRDQPVTYVPNRNMLLLSIAAAYAESKGSSDVFYGAQAQDDYGYWDCTIDFIEKINDVLALNRRDAVNIAAPFVRMSKTEVVSLGLELGVDYGHTWTCYRGGDEPCGVCPSCIERERAFESVNS
jgi:7-cyano-7-deazaguanine synthase